MTRQGPGYRSMALDEMDEVPWKGSMTWQPVRAQLGVRAFGVAGFTAREAGELVVEPHRA